ncbi:autotransporter domain-containing protein [Pandoraea pnomenusa]|uniref:autotransporter family protein n=1 Tax=Pandoraea pnomenusa TaxID=93220 RepID=UPI00333EE402
MYKNHPKSNALRQTKICMAAAAVVAAAALPSYVGAEEAVPEWQTTKNTRLNELNGKIETDKNASGEMNLAKETLKHKESYKGFSDSVREAFNKSTAKEKLDALDQVAKDIQVEITKLSKVVDNGQPAHHQAQLAALEKLKAALGKIDTDKLGGHQDKTDLEGLVAQATVTQAVTTATTALAKAKTKLDNLNLLKHKQDAWDKVSADADVQTLAKTFVLDANASGVEKNGANTKLAWSDKNLQTFATDDAVSTTASAHTKIDADATLELGSFSGSASDAIHGLTESGGNPKTRNIGTLRALEGADHAVDVTGGVMNVKNGIEGSGKLSIDVGAKGELNFLKDGKGIDAGAEQISLTAKGAASGSDPAGKINFGENTSAGKARIDVSNGAELNFAKDAKAGGSTITIRGEITAQDVKDAKALDGDSQLAESKSASATFDMASAENATINNSGNLTFKGGSLGNAKITNEAKGTVTIEGKDVPDLDAEGEQKEDAGGNKLTKKKQSLGGNANVTNRGKLTATDTNLQKLTLTNDGGTSTIAKSSGDDVTISNFGAEAKLVISNSKVAKVALFNAARAEISGLTGDKVIIANSGEKGDLTVSNSTIHELGLINDAKAEVSGLRNAKASISNSGESGNLTVDGSQFTELGMVNDAQAEISASAATNAIVSNKANGNLRIADSKFASLNLTNDGNVTMRGNTTTDNATIVQNGGKFDVSGITADGGVKFGSLSGAGDIIVGENALTIGSLNQDETFGGKILASEPNASAEDEATADAQRAPRTTVDPSLTKVGSGNLTLSGDQSAVKSIEIDAGKLTAAHQNALGSGDVGISSSAALVVATSHVSGVKTITNAGEINLGLNKLSVETYESATGAKIKTTATKADGKVSTGLIHVEKNGDFSDTDLQINRDGTVKLKDVVGQNIQVVTKGNGADVNAKFNSVRFGSVLADGTDDGNVTITKDSRVGFLAKDGAYTDNERAALASVDGVTYGDITTGKVGGDVLAEMLEQTSGSAEQRRSAGLLSGESLVNNAYAAQGSATAFQRGMQTRMIAGGAMFDEKTTNGANANANGSGVAGWAAFAGGNTAQRGNGPSFDVRSLDGAIGVDKRVGDNTIVGASVGMGNQDSKARGVSGESKINSVSLGLYGSHLNDTRWFVNGGASYTNHSVRTDRAVAAGDVSARLSGSTGGRTFGAFGEVGKRFEVSGMNIDPSVGVRVASTRLNAFDETNRDGGSNDGLNVGAQSQTSTRGVLGVRLWREVANVGGTKVAPSLRLAYEHEFGDTQSILTNTIYGAPRSFNVKGAKLGADIFTADLGVNVEVKKALDVRLGGNLSVRKGERAVGGSISAMYRF